MNYKKGNAVAVIKQDDSERADTTPYPTFRKRLTGARVEKPPVGFPDAVPELLLLLEVHLPLVPPAPATRRQLYPLEVRADLGLPPRGGRGGPPLALAAPAVPPQPPRGLVLLVDDGRRLVRLTALYRLQVVGPGLVAAQTLEGLGPVLVRARRASPVRLSGVASVAVVVLLAGVQGGGLQYRDRVAARVGVQDLGGGGPATLGQTLRAADSPGPVQVGAHLTRPLVGGLSGAGGSDAGPGTGVWADEKATTSTTTTTTTATTDLSSGGAPAHSWVHTGAANVGFLCDDRTTGPLCVTHGALDCRGPVLIGAVVAVPLHSLFCHGGSFQMGRL